MRHHSAAWSEFRFKMPHKMPVNATFITHFSGMLRLQQIVQYGIVKNVKTMPKPLDSRSYLMSRGLEFVVISMIRSISLKVLLSPSRDELRREPFHELCRE